MDSESYEFNWLFDWVAEADLQSENVPRDGDANASRRSRGKGRMMLVSFTLSIRESISSLATLVSIQFEESLHQKIN